MNDDAEHRIMDAIRELRDDMRELRDEMREELRALRRGVEYIGERLFGPSGRPEFQSQGEMDEFRTRMRKAR